MASERSRPLGLGGAVPRAGPESETAAPQMSQVGSGWGSVKYIMGTGRSAQRSECECKQRQASNRVHDAVSLLATVVSRWAVPLQVLLLSAPVSAADQKSSHAVQFQTSSTLVYC